MKSSSSRALSSILVSGTFISGLSLNLMELNHRRCILGGGDNPCKEFIFSHVSYVPFTLLKESRSIGPTSAQDHMDTSFTRTVQATDLIFTLATQSQRKRRNTRKWSQGLQLFHQKYRDFYILQFHLEAKPRYLVAPFHGFLLGSSKLMATRFTRLIQATGWEDPM